MRGQPAGDRQDDGVSGKVAGDDPFAIVDCSRQGVAMTLFGLAALLAPVVGPTLGGWITDSYSWRWVFFINVPVGATGSWNPLPTSPRPLSAHLLARLALNAAENASSVTRSDRIRGHDPLVTSVTRSSSLASRAAAASSRGGFSRVTIKEDGRS